MRPDAPRPFHFRRVPSLSKGIVVTSREGVSSNIALETVGHASTRHVTESQHLTLGDFGEIDRSRQHAMTIRVSMECLLYLDGGEGHDQWFDFPMDHLRGIVMSWLSIFPSFT